MHVGEYMTRDPITVSEDTSMKEAMLLLRTHHIRHLPVADGKVLVGLVSDRDIRKAAPSLLSGIGKNDYEQVLEGYTRRPHHDPGAVHRYRKYIARRRGVGPRREEVRKSPRRRRYRARRHLHRNRRAEDLAGSAERRLTLARPPPHEATAEFIKPAS